MLQERCAEVYADIEKLIKENARHAQNQAEYQEHYADLAARYEIMKSRLTALEDEKKSKLLRRQKIVAFVENLQEQNTILNDFDDGIFRAMTDHMTVYSKRNISVTFKDGNEIHVDLLTV